MKRQQGHEHWDLHLLRQDNNQVLSVADGSLVIGRRLLKLEDLRLSRAQLAVQMDSETAQASAMWTGTNPSFIRGSAASEWQSMEKNTQYELRDGMQLKVLSTGPVLDVKLRPRAEPSEESAKKLHVELEAGKIFTAVFPSVSTGAFGFDAERAAHVLVDQVQAFLATLDQVSADVASSVRLVLVDSNAQSPILQLVDRLWRKRCMTAQPVLDTRFSCRVADITRVCSQGGIAATVLVNCANRDLSPGGSGVNAAIFQAIPELVSLTKSAQATAGVRTLPVGLPLLVPLPTVCPFVIREGVQAVVHVLGPNMSPNRPDCMTDYHEASSALAQCYRNVFRMFFNFCFPNYPPMELDRTVSNHVASSTNGNANHNNNNNGSSNSNGHSNVNSNHNNGGSVYRISEPVGGGFVNTNGNGSSSSGSAAAAAAAHPVSYVQTPVVAEAGGGWSGELLKFCAAPESFPDSVAFFDDKLVVLLDKYPKAQHHFLVMPRVRIELYDLTDAHIPLLESMLACGRDFVFKRGLGTVKFRMGFHRVPSMKQLHMHIISQDFRSQCLKNKKHWNSFTTTFFLDADQLLQTLRTEKRYKVNKAQAEELLNAPLRCHICSIQLPTIPKLKLHISTHE